MLLRTNGTGLLRTGYTLIELIVVIVVMAILAAFAAPRFFTPSAFEGPAFAQDLAAAARYAQKLAIANNCPVRLVVTAGAYSLLQAQATVPACSGALVMTLPATHPGTGNAFTANVPAGVTLAPAATVEFSASGVPFVGGAVMTADLDLVTGGRTVRIYGRSGYVELRP